MLCADYDAAPELHLSRKRKMKFKEHIYQSVKPELTDCHRGKCCYCEARFKNHKPLVYSAVEHWRPKATYYWLVYSWDNLLLSCIFCNTTKRNEFPLANPHMRAIHHGMHLEDETPEIIKPDADEDPRVHIRFCEDRPEGITDLGWKTIEVLGLDSPEHSSRSDYLTELRKKRRLWIDLMDSDNPSARLHAEEARRFVEDSPHPDRPYSAMAAAFLEANPLPQPAAMRVMTAGEMPPELSNAE